MRGRDGAVGAPLRTIALKSDARKKQIPRFARDDSAPKFFCDGLGIGDSTGFYLADFVEALAEALLETLVGGLVVSAAGEIVGEAGHVGDFIIEIVGGFVALTIANIFHQAGDGIADVDSHWFGR